MPNLAKYTVELEAQVQKYERNLDRANKKLDRFNKQQNTALDRVGRGFIRLGATIAAAFSGAAITRQLNNIERETGVLTASLETATGSIEGAQVAFRELERFAARTPFALEESVTAFTRLVNLGLTPSERALTSYGNTAAATGKTILQFVEAVADASVGEFERLKEFGIKASKEGDKVTFRFRGLSTEVGNSIREIEDFLIGLGEQEFGGGLERRIDTLDGKLSNLGDSWDALFRAINDAGVGDAIKASVDVAIVSVDALSQTLNTVFNDEIFALQSRLVQLNKQIDSIGSGGFFSAFSDQDELNEKLRERAEILSRIQELRERISGGAAGGLEQFTQQVDIAGGSQGGVFAGPSPETSEQAFARQAALTESFNDYNARLLELAANAPGISERIGSIYTDSADRLAELVERQRDASARFTELFGDNLVQAANSGFDGILEGWARTLQQMAARLLTSQLFNLLANIGGGGAGTVGGFFTTLFGGGRASGGPVRSGTSYLVGERGPELFTPSSSGQIIANGAGGGQMTFNIDARGASADVVPLIEDGVRRAVRLAARDRQDARRRGE